MAESSCTLPTCSQPPVLTALCPKVVLFSAGSPNTRSRACSNATLACMPTSLTNQRWGIQTVDILRKCLMEVTQGGGSDLITKRHVLISVQVQFPEWHYLCSVNSLLFKRLLTVHICTNVFMLHSFQVNNNGFLLLIIHEPFCPIIMKF